jgi:hypothetical protein
MASPHHNGVVKIVPGRCRNRDGLFSVLVKRSYGFRHGCVAERLERDAPLRLIDRYYDDGGPEHSVVEHENEVSPLKAATDVVVVGRAHAPAGEATPAMVAGLRIGEHEKRVQVIGDRQCHWRDGAAPHYSDPEPFVEMPIRYDRAYGGRDERSDPDQPFFYPRNDRGRGLALRNLREVVQDLPLPNIEDPDDLLLPERVVIDDPRHWSDQPLPQGLGWRQRTWYPRSALMGDVPAYLEAGRATTEERMQLLPPNHVALAKQMKLPPFDAQFANGASFGLVLDDVKGDEAVALRGLSALGALDFALPGDTPQIALDLGQGPQPLATKIHIISIRPDDLQLDIVWRGSLVFGAYSKLASIRRLEATVS